MKSLESFLSSAVDFIWGVPLLILLLGGGFYFLVYSRFLPFRYLLHAVNVLRGKFDNPDDPGEINHFEALSGALAATIGMGNVSGVALAIAAGGPGAIFWMWMSAFLGMATKYFTCTLAVLYRGKDAEGNLQGGPMYVIREGLGKKWMLLAGFFCVAAFLGASPVFQANQMVAVLKEVILIPAGASDGFYTDLIIGLVITVLVAMVIVGGVKRIGNVASKLVPAMVLLFVFSVLVIMLLNASAIIPSFLFILEDAFTAKAALGGAVGAIIIEGAKRAAFSNEAGIGTAPMMHGAAKTKEPVREGLVAMLGPAIDTIVVCTMTGLCIIMTGAWQAEISGNFSSDTQGILMTTLAFEDSLPGFGPYVLMICVMIFAITTIFGMAYYGQKCLGFLIGPKYIKYYNVYYLILVVIGSVSSLSLVINLIFVGYGLMSIPTMISGIILAPKVMEASKSYFDRMSI
ncbi:MAG: alanine/glycine:cation symporter family protein [Cyclobacteriaceae bacterium]